MTGVLNLIPNIAKLSEGHDEHLNISRGAPEEGEVFADLKDAVHGSLHWIVFLLVVVAHENEVISLPEAHQEYEVDRSKSHEVLGQHSDICQGKAALLHCRLPTCIS